MKRFFVLLIGVFIFSACGAILDSGTSSGSGAEPPEIEEEPAPSYYINEILQLTNWQFTVTDNVGFAETVETGGTVSMVFEPTRDDRIFAYVPVEITNISEERRRMLPIRLETPTQLTARLVYAGEDGNVVHLPIALSGSVGDVIDRPISPGDTVTGRVFFQIRPEIENSTSDVRLEIRTNAGDVMGVFSIR
ncbi:MAG: DUF4352 domain-containing protein [Defluviitaleaceae bacterium]|nr:DUF4352 domain-containing protein [Defluviitaleaceae bacterium]